MIHENHGIRKDLKMEMMYDGALVMPKNYAVVNEEEMTYVDGGWCVDTHWWGWNLYLTSKECDKLKKGMLGVALAAILSPAKIFAIVAFAGNVIDVYNKGHGVKIRLTAREIPTGIWTLDKADEKNMRKRIHSYNK